MTVDGAASLHLGRTAHLVRREVKVIMYHSVDVRLRSFLSGIPRGCGSRSCPRIFNSLKDVYPWMNKSSIAVYTFTTRRGDVREDTR